MKQEKMTFESHKLQVDFLTLSMDNVSNTKRIHEFANYLFKNSGFNCFLSEGNTRKITQTLFQNLATKDTAIIRINYWKVTIIEFPGQSGQRFYQQLKSRKLDWRFFPSHSLNLTRLDLCYELIKTDTFKSQELDEFLIKSRRHILDKTQTRTVKLINSKKGVILGINKRSNPRYVRIYETKSTIRFELELKNSALKNVKEKLFSYQFDDFESQLTELYFHYIKKFFVLDSYFVTWLIDFIRKDCQTQTHTQPVLAVEYFTNITCIFENQPSEKVYHLLQFLNFIKTLNRENCTQHLLEGKTYFIHNFPLNDFINFIGIKDIETQRLNTREYFSQLHKNDPIIEQFQDGSFCIFATFLCSSVYKKSNRWFVKIYINEDLYQHVYPFLFSRSFRNYDNRTDCVLKLELIRSISVKSTKKVFYLSQFMEQLKLSGRRIVNVKQDLIFLIKEIVQQGIIQSRLELVHKNGDIRQLDQDQLTIKILNTKVKYLVFYEKLD